MDPVYSLSRLSREVGVGKTRLREMIHDRRLVADRSADGRKSMRIRRSDAEEACGLVFKRPLASMDLALEMQLDRALAPTRTENAELLSAVGELTAVVRQLAAQLESRDAHVQGLSSSDSTRGSLKFVSAGGGGLEGPSDSRRPAPNPLFP